MSSPAITAQKLIRAKGRRDGILRRPGADSVVLNGKPWAPTDADPTAVPLIASALAVVILDQSDMSDRLAQAIAPEATAVCLLPALELPAGAVVLLGDLIEAGTLRYAVIQVDLLAPAGTPIIYTLSLKAR